MPTSTSRPRLLWPTLTSTWIRVIFFFICHQFLKCLYERIKSRWIVGLFKGIRQSSSLILTKHSLSWGRLGNIHSERLHWHRTLHGLGNILHSSGHRRHRGHHHPLHTTATIRSLRQTLRSGSLRKYRRLLVSFLHFTDFWQIISHGFSIGS